MNPVCILGTGPAALVAAHRLTGAGVRVRLFERRPSAAWKLLVAGSSGLNVAYDCAAEKLPSYYPERARELSECFREFGREQWLSLLHSLGEPTYLGSSRRYFLENRTAASLTAKWVNALERTGAVFVFGEEFVDFSRVGDAWELRFRSGRTEKAANVIFALGGASWETVQPAWAEAFARHGLRVTPFAPANAGYSFRAPPEFFAANEGKPLKGLTLTTAKGSRQGELMITHYGLEGTPVYTLGCPGMASVDLKPDLTAEKFAQRLREGRGNVRQRVETRGKLSPGAMALALALLPASAWETVETAAAALKNMPLELLEPRSLRESISSRGGLSWDELDENLQLRKFPGFFAAGEMVDWDAPTGGFLLTACASMGWKAAGGVLAR